LTGGTEALGLVHIGKRGQQHFSQEVAVMKRLGIVLLAALFGLALACGSAEEKKPPAKAPAPPAATAPKAPEQPKAEPGKPEHPKAEPGKPEHPKPGEPKPEHPK
jgi:hypothetical protein